MASIKRTAEKYIQEIETRMSQGGLTAEEAVAEIQAEEEAEREAADYIRIVFQLPLTVWVVHKEGKDVLPFISQTLQDASFELISLSETSGINGLWQRLLRLATQTVWVVNEVEQARDAALQSVIYAMLRREKYAPSGLPAIDFGTIRLVLMGTAEGMPACFEDVSSFENAIEVAL